MGKEKNTNVDYTQKVLEVKDLKKYFFSGTGKKKLVVPAVDGITFDVYKREVFGLVGESGCGKTTTGRTIIKLYTPTDGSVDLNGLRISAGYKGNQMEIKKIKKETKDEIASFNAYKKEVIQINKKLDQDVDFLKQDIQLIKNKELSDIKEVNRELEHYNTKKYDIRSIYRLDVEKLNYAFGLSKAKIIEATQNPAEREYQYQLNIAKNRYKKKVEGLKESAALKKEVLEQRIETLRKGHEELIESLKQKYEPLISKDEANKLDKKDAKAQIAELNSKLKKDLTERKAKFLEDKKQLVMPDQKSAKEQIKKIQAEAKGKINQKREEIKKLKLEAKKTIAGISKDKLKVTEANQEKIDQIKAESKLKIQEQKDLIKEIKESNNSSEALLASRKMLMIFQDPISSLNPRMTVKEIVGEGLTILGGYSDDEINKKVGEALELVGLDPEYGARYPHEFSGGQRQRIGIARALIMQPNFIIADEPVSALDVSIRAQVINLLSKLRDELGLTMLFIAHDLSVVRFFCDRIAVMYYGKIVEVAESEELFKNPMHPYTVSLLSAIPHPDPDYEKGRKRVSYDPSMHDYRMDRPTLREVAPGHTVYANEKEFKEMQKKYKADNEKKPSVKKSGGEKA